MPPRKLAHGKKNSGHDIVKPSTSRLATCFMPYARARSHLGDPFLREIVETRHMTLGWQHATNVGAVIRKKVMASVGRFIESLHAIPIAIGKIVAKRSIYIVEDHDCMHLDVTIHMIAFVCNLQCNKPLKCRAVLVSGNSVVGQLYNIITVVNKSPIPNLKKDDEFNAHFAGVEFDGNLCQIVTHVNKKRLKFD